MRRLFKVCLPLLLFSCLALADTINVGATGEGSCSSSSGCNNSNSSTIANTLAGSYLGTSYSDWFAFDIPNLSGSIIGATFTYFNAAGNSSTGFATYNLYTETGVTTFSNILAGTFAGSTGVPFQGGELVSFVLNSDAIAHLNSSQSSRVFFAGYVPNAAASNAQIFGSTNGTPVATLKLETVPEPGSILLLGTGLLGLIGSARRKLFN